MAVPIVENTDIKLPNVTTNVAKQCTILSVAEREELPPLPSRVSEAISQREIFHLSV